MQKAFIITAAVTSLIPVVVTVGGQSRQVAATTRSEWIKFNPVVADGLSNKAAAARLGISDETVKFHLSAIFGKLQASNRTDAVSEALRRGLIEL
jgi:DNA-binding NarL/FixJ family response regulator